MQEIIQIYPWLLKLSRQQESVTDGQIDGRPLLLYIPPRYRGGIITALSNHKPGILNNYIRICVNSKLLYLIL